MGSIDVSVIIVNYNTCELTLNCINSIFEKTTGISFEIIVVDNHSTDGSKELFEADKRVIYIYNSQNVGFGAANNIGYKHSIGNYLLFLNSDTYLVNDAISILWEKFSEIAEDSRIPHAKVACAGTMLLNTQGEITHSYAKFPTMRGVFLSNTIYPILWKLHIISSLPSSSNYKCESIIDGEYDVDYITGADLMVSRRVVEKYGLFDEDFFMYYEETEMQFRYMKAGLRRIIFNGPQIVHLEGGSYKKTSLQKTSIFINSMFVFFKKTRNAFAFEMFAVILKIGMFFCFLISFPFIKGNSCEKIKYLYNLARA